MHAANAPAERIVFNPITPTSVALAAIQAEVERYRLALETHPLARVFAGAQAPRALVQAFAELQYVDSVLWVPMLALMKDRVAAPRLKRALTENLLCEAGARHTSHVTLCREFVESVGVSPYFGDFNAYSSLATQPVEVMNSVSGLSEAQIAGWILAGESVVPQLFKMVLPAFKRQPGADVRYLTEHISVDGDEHAVWMREAIEELLDRGTPLSGILEGVHLGGRTALNVPDALYARFVRGGYSDRH